MSGRSLVLVCTDLAADLPSLGPRLEQAVPGAELVLVEELCRRPAEATAAVQAAAATRVVVVCDRPASPSELRAACLRGGVEPFGVELLVLPHGLPVGGVVLLVTAALAKLRALPEGVRGKPSFGNRSLSRRSLFSPASVLVQEPVALIDAARCAGGKRCGLCVAACPQDAISTPGALPRVQDSRCDACGRCVPACPQGAIQVAGSSTAQLEAQLRVLASSGSRVELACVRASATPQPGWLRVELPSLAAASAGWPLQLLAHGAADVSVRPCDGECCREWRDGRQELLAGLRELVAPPPDPDPEGLILGEPAATASALRLLTRVRDGEALEHPESPLGRLDCDDTSCTLCGACAAACPTGAIALDEGGEDAVLRHDPARCVACGRCVGTCPEGSLRVRRGIDLDRLRNRELRRGNRESLIRERVEQLLAELT